MWPLAAAGGVEIYPAGMRQWTGTRGRTDILLATVIGAPVAALSVFMAFVSAPGTRAWLVAVSLIVAHAALAARRVSPAASFGVVCAAFAMQTAVTGMFLVLPSTLVFPVALYSVCAFGSRRVVALALGAGVVGAVLVTVRFVHDGSVTAAGLRPDPFLVSGLLLAVVVAAWSLGLRRRTQLAYLAVLRERARHVAAEREERARRAVREERARITREMHDVIAHSLSVIISQAKGGRYAARSDPDRASNVLSTIEETGRHALADMRGLLGVLRSGETNDDGPGQEPQPALRDLPELLDRVRAAGLPVHHREHGTTRRLSPVAELAVFRVVQEALTNIIKHAGPTARAEVEFAWAPDGLTVTVRDRGPERRPVQESGHGLTGMRERIAAVGGSISAEPALGGGFLVTARLPYDARLFSDGGSA
ncbi:Sensor histidine kinase DesK [Micromonospora sp. MW-13]|nr:Sensor histidine kinase DesK [Micromonospora sp. MW-13]